MFERGLCIKGSVEFWVLSFELKGKDGLAQRRRGAKRRKKYWPQKGTKSARGLGEQRKEIAARRKNSQNIKRYKARVVGGER